MMQKKTLGRKKKSMKKIDEHSSRPVTFSNRRSRLFRKASELSVLTGAEVAILVESPGGLVYGFGSPSVESVMGRYLGGSSTGAPDPQQPGSELDRAMLELDRAIQAQYKQQYSEKSKEMEAEKNKKAAMEEKKEENHWWEELSFKGLGLEELEQYITVMEKLRDNLITRAKELGMI